MKSTEVQQRFITLRSQGWSFARIAEELQMSKTTLIEWSRRFQFEINNLKAIETEALQQRYLVSREEQLRALSEQLRKVETELGQRDLATVSTPRLFSLAVALRSELQRASGSMQFSSSIRDIPNEEYHEEAQDWNP